MIRRDVHSSPGSPRWMLIAQPEHARLSADLARHWGAGGTTALCPYTEVLGAIVHHDDGWAEWEQHRDVDPQTGRPLAFTEMPTRTSLEIWSRSIAVVEKLGHLAPWLVARHFSVLLRSSTGADHEASRRWLEEFDGRCERWLTAWQAGDPGRNTLEVAERALAQVRMFDALSLWFCCAARTKPQTFPTPSGPRLTLTPVSPEEIVLSPWPLQVETLDLQVSGELVPVAHYTDRQMLAAAEKTSHVLRWRVRPDPDAR